MSNMTDKRRKGKDVKEISFKGKVSKETITCLTVTDEDYHSDRITYHGNECHC